MERENAQLTLWITKLLLKLRARKGKPVSSVDVVRRPIVVKADIADVTASRAIGPTYTNNTGRPLMMLLSVIHEVTVQGTFLLIQAASGASISWSGWYDTPAVGIMMYGTIVLLIPNKGTYSVVQNNAGGVNAIIKWVEYTL